MEVTESQLATALEGFSVRARTATSGSVSVELADADDTAKALYATLSRMATLRDDGPFTREQLVRQAEDGVLVTRQVLAGALRRVPQQEGSHHPWWPHAQRLLLSILAEARCESCSRADNGSGYPCGCPVPCGARYCQHPMPCDAGSPGAEAAAAVPSHAEEAKQALSASEWQRQQWGEHGHRDEWRACQWEMERAKVHALLGIEAALSRLAAHAGSAAAWAAT